MITDHVCSRAQAHTVTNGCLRNGGAGVGATPPPPKPQSWREFLIRANINVVFVQNELVKFFVGFCFVL